VRFLRTNSGAWAMHVPNMPSERASAFVPVKLISALAVPTSGYPSASADTVSQLRNSRPQGPSSTSRMIRFAL
jgi:hypothetical protein